VSRLAFGALGTALALFPRHAVDLYERVAFENPEECSGSRWLLPVVRAEGVAFALCGLAGGRAYAWLLNLTGVAGAAALLSPRRYLEFGTGLVYERPERLTVADRFVAVVRALGVLYVFVAVRAYRKRRAGE
jgi:hypothetical protein